VNAAVSHFGSKSTLGHMSAKRKQVLLPKEELDAEWDALATVGSQIKHGRMEIQMPKQELIMTQLVEFNTKKHQYAPVPQIKEKQYGFWSR